jgi:hypothetical protein
MLRWIDQALVDAEAGALQEPPHQQEVTRG